MTVRRRGNAVFVMNFSDEAAEIELYREYTNIISGETLCGKVTLGVCGYLVLE